MLIILFGVFLQIVQLAYSIWKRKELKAGPDPWNGRTLEWSVPSPAPAYNFTAIPTVRGRDPFWQQKMRKKPVTPEYEDIEEPRHTGAGIVIAFGAGVFAFAVIWHLWWLALLALILTIVAIIFRAMAEDTTVLLKASEVRRLAS